MANDTHAPRDIVIQGYCAPGRERLREAFLRNFRELGEIGASYTVVAGGEVVADLWAGSKDEEGTTPWERDTVVCVWSASKGVAGVCFAMIVDRGLASYDDKVSRYWTEFAAEGNGDVTIGMLLSHQAGLPGFDTPATLDELFAGEPAARRLAAQKPMWKPGTAAGYSNVVGIAATHLFERIEGRSIQRFVAEELKGSLGLEISVGLEPADRPRLSSLVAAKSLDPTSAVPMGTPAQRALHNPPMTVALPDTPQFQAADFTAANCYATARGLAGLYGLLLNPGADGRRLVGPRALAEATRTWIDGIDLVRGIRRTWAAGFLTNVEGAWGPNKGAFGHGGWGGAFGFADPAAGVAVGYVMNHMSDQMDLNPRRRNLIDAIYAGT
jgi:CubicO group peptidase (beta-lactamase class C family)